jgi:hypothetical protein
MGKHDDMVDALGLIGQLLATVLAGKRPDKRKAQWDPRQDAYRSINTDRELEAYAMGGASALNWHGDDDDGYFSIKTL